MAAADAQHLLTRSKTVWHKEAIDSYSYRPAESIVSSGSGWFLAWKMKWLLYYTLWHFMTENANSILTSASIYKSNSLEFVCFSRNCCDSIEDNRRLSWLVFLAVWVCLQSPASTTRLRLLNIFLSVCLILGDRDQWHSFFEHDFFSEHAVSETKMRLTELVTPINNISLTKYTVLPSTVIGEFFITNFTMIFI